ncbi:MAG TPA: YbhB/YbcL family Raf kinase inhibitor-like protein [Tepidisphaeraceae bacterium]|jgi:hypothetical protein|nr:YbhB/YbcL family Raf kinase inhibitor-like protein [Tepidisphaeraceae bacterium]
MAVGTTTLRVTSNAFGPGEPIPQKYSGDGKDVSPPLNWRGVPTAARELALIVEDPDAPQAEPFIHWVIYKIPTSEMGLPEGMPREVKLESPAGALQGKNSFKQIGYNGPAPPPGHGTHHYHFRLYVLDQALDVRGGLDAKSLHTAMAGHIVDEAELVGTYER